ncbi:FadR/GntR family transcriptional regulator [Diplocloster hominis]|uniref:FadR/GntR family transcriptional regulator n=1 Tax=Diplocloster hominis TaxID=3079010 RepID=UPI0031BB00D9
MKEIRRISVTDTVVERIQELIDSGEYEPGQKLPTESNLCENLKVSRTSVREAMRMLQALGYVDILPGKGAYVAEYQKIPNHSNWYDIENARFNDFMEVRMAIETLAVRLSVERATKKQVGELESINQSFLEAVNNHDGPQMIMLDELYHSKIIEFTDNNLLININKQLLASFRKYRGDSFMNTSVYANAVEPHTRILQCFQIRAPLQAVEEMKNHLNITAKDMEIIHTKSDEQEGQ